MPVSSRTFDELAAMPADAVVRAVIRPVQGGEPATTPNPRAFGSAVEYRAALAKQQRAQRDPGRHVLAERARALGLETQASNALGTMVVAGPVALVQQFLHEPAVDSALLERTLTMRL